ncbi:MAG: metalloprotease TldD, partial [Acidobacteriota bacterium]
MSFSQSFFAERFGITEHDLESYLSEALSAGGDYADVYFEYLATSRLRKKSDSSVTREARAS